MEEIVKPENETQQKLFDCIAEVLGYTEFGITTDIYEAGLTSITAIKLNILISKAFDIVIKTSDIKDHPTIQMLESFGNFHRVYSQYGIHYLQHSISSEA